MSHLIKFKVCFKWIYWMYTHQVICWTKSSSHIFKRISSAQLLSPVWLFATPWTAAHQASLVHHQLLEFIQTHVHWVSDSIQPSHPLSSPYPPAFSLSQHQIFSNESALHIRWPKYWSFSFTIFPSKEHPGLVSFRMTGWISLQSKGLSRVFSNTTVQKYKFFSAQPSL